MGGGIARTSLIEASGSTAYRDQAERHARMFSALGTSRLRPSRMRSRSRSPARSPRPKIRYAVGGGAKPILLLRALSDRMFDRVTRSALRRHDR